MIEASTTTLTPDELRTLSGLTTASEFQVDIFKFIAGQVLVMIENHRRKKTKGLKIDVAPRSLIVNAVAGSGKTTTIVAANRIILSLLEGYREGLQGMERDWFSPKVLFLAFNKSIANELALRLPKEVWSKTLNALGHSVLIQYLKNSMNIHGVEVSTTKTWKIMKNIMVPEEVKRFGGDIAFLVAKCKSMGIVPIEGIPDIEPLHGRYATDDVLESICIHYGKEIDPTNIAAIFKYTREVLLASILDLTLIDFDDQKYLPVILRPNGNPIKMYQYDIIGLDEAQDVNPVDLELVRMSLKSNGFLIAIGDKNQSIYGFRAADVESIEKIQDKFNAEHLPLSITYRCAKKIVEAAEKVHPGILAAPNAIEGKVERIAKYDATLFKHWSPTATPSQRKSIHDMVVCRNNAPLVKLAFRLIRARVAIHMMGRDFGKELISLIRKLVGDSKLTNPFKNTNLIELASTLTQWEDNQISIIRAKDDQDEASIERVRDRADTIRVFMEDNKDNRVETIVLEIQKLFNTDSQGPESAIPTNRVILSTGHKSKGLESIRVFFLDKHLMFPQYVVKGSWQYDQERNLLYVITTRAKEYLGYIRSDGWV